MTKQYVNKYATIDRKEWWENEVIDTWNKLFWDTEGKIEDGKITDFGKALIYYTGIIHLSDSNIHKIHTSMDLIKEIMDNYPPGYDYTSTTWLVIYTFEWALYLKYVLEVPSENITIVGDGNERKDLAMHEGFNYVGSSYMIPSGNGV